MTKQDIRWIQRLDGYRRAVAKVSQAVDNMQLDRMSDLEKEGLIQRFEYTYELAWKTLQDFIRAQGIQDVAGPKAVIRQAIDLGYIANREVWNDMMEARNLTAHTYNDSTADRVAQMIFVQFCAELEHLLETLDHEAAKLNAEA